MGQKIFFERDGYRVVADERDIALSTKHTLEVERWCRDSGINVELVLSGLSQRMIERTFHHNIWRVKDQNERALFLLRWSNVDSD
jgi:hypothetical protein